MKPDWASSMPKLNKEQKQQQQKYQKYHTKVASFMAEFSTNRSEILVIVD